MCKIGFSDKWIGWIMMCVESADYSVKVNKDMMGPIILEHGMRQVDPLSPYIYHSM